ncbi:MAG: glutathione synthase [Ruminococcus sp.]
MSLNYNNPLTEKNMLKASFGLEKESLRIDKDGFLSHTKHPFESNRNIDRDFCENQIEIITDVFENADDLYKNLEEIQGYITKSLSELKTGQEFLWNFSNPPYVKGENDIPVASFKGDLKSKELYRNYLAEKYGKKKMLFSGIHFNFSFDDELLKIGFNESGFSDYKQYKNNVYLQLAKQLTKYSWLIVYLMSASPVTDGSFFDDRDLGKTVVTEYSSIRCGKEGYWNDFVPVLKYTTIEEYVKNIQEYINSGRLASVSELYYPIRLKPKGENSLDNLVNSGVNHIELRMLDINPLSPVGIKKEDIYFLHLLIVYLSSLEDIEFDEKEQIEAVENIKNSSLLYDKNICIKIGGKSLSIKEEALKILENTERFFNKHSNKKALQIISYQKDKILKQDNRYAVIVKNKFGNDYVKKGIELSRKYLKA